MRPSTLIVCTVFMLSAAPLAGQISRPPIEAPNATHRQEANQNVLLRLREGNLEQSLKLLEVIADAARPFSLAEANDISAACAGLHRSLMQLDAEAQFELLRKWSMPYGAPERIRVLTSLVPTIVPPTEFARALGERPRENSFSVASIGEVNGIFSTAWSLVIAARESGRLKRLTIELGPLVDRKVPNADLLLTLAQIADGKDAPWLNAQFSERLAQLKGSQQLSGLRARGIEAADVVLAAAALQHPMLRTLGEEMFAVLAKAPIAGDASRIRPFLRRAHATAVLLINDSQNQISVASQLTNRLKYWVAVSEEDPTSSAPSFTECVWLAHEDQILHLSGSGHDTLLLRYPLLDDFRFQFETQTGNPIETNGGIAYGGLRLQAADSSQSIQVLKTSGEIEPARYCPFFLPGTFTRFSLLSSDNSAKLAVNLHPMRNDVSGFEASPWVGMTSADQCRPLFRNVKITGNPSIPRSVALSEDLRGWRPQTFGSRDSKLSRGDAKQKDNWRQSDGVIQFVNNEPSATSTRVEQLLTYQRPVLAGESVTYEFFYEPGAEEVSPALGRVAFLMQPDGVRIHWVTDGDQDWTGLAVDNAVTEPLNRRGPRPLPLKPQDWNRVTVSRTEAAVALSLNDQVVYQRPVNWTGDHRFSFYRHNPESGVRVRNATLTGDWPETLPQDFKENPVVTVDDSLPATSRHLFNRLFHEELLATNVREIRRKACSMPLRQRFEFLSQWVLPGPEHTEFRVGGYFSQTRPAPIAYEPGVANPELGGQIVSPVYDWLDSAKELGLLSKCRQRVEDAAAPNTEFQQRARIALLILLDLELDLPEKTSPNFDTLYSLFKSQVLVGVDDQWPETLIVDRGVRKFANVKAVAELINHLYWQRTQGWRPADNHLWHGHMMSLFGQMQILNEGGDISSWGSTTELKDWVPVVTARFHTRGEGYPNLYWHRHVDYVDKLACHDMDFLLYRLPLSGDFEVETDVREHAKFMIAGKFHGVYWNRKQLNVGGFRGDETPIPADPPFPSFDTWCHYRGVVRDGVCTLTVNGRQVKNEELPGNHSPWVGIHAWKRNRSGLRDFRVTGQPVVLDAVPMSESSDLTGWISYYDEPLLSPGSVWVYTPNPKSGGMIGSRTNRALNNTFAESLLQYVRPLVEDGSIEYEFFYDPGVIETYPALDRLAFLLSPNGVREHWITDSRNDHTDVGPDNVIDNPHCQRGSAPLPLNSRQWNQMKLILRGNTVKLELNNELVYERELEPGNLRTFGLFHYLDQTEVRVRNVEMRGDWPKAVPTPAQQEMGGEMADTLDADLPRLKAVFSHDFESDGLPDKYFVRPNPGNGGSIGQVLSGIEVIRSSNGGWTGIDIASRFSLSGDFDIEAEFTELNLETTKNANAQLTVVLRHERKPEYNAVRICTENGEQKVHSGWSIVQPGGSRSWHSTTKPCESTSGRLRLARRGDKIYWLFAEDDSVVYRVVSVETAYDLDTERNGVLLRSHSMGDGSSKVVWKNLKIRAEKMTWYPDSSESLPAELRIVQVDGQVMRTIAKPAALNFTHISSPKWSADGRRIAFGMSLGSMTTSHVFVANSDGTGLKDIGMGCMPSFSEDGKRIVCSEPGKGIVTMNSDGTDRRVIEAAGWGAQWSPDGKWIAYSKGDNITLFDVKTQKTRTLLTREVVQRYKAIYGNLAFSHDSRTIAFKAPRRDGNPDELAVADLDSKDSFKVLLSNANSVVTDFMFSPDNQDVIIVYGSGAQDQGLYRINRKSPGPPAMIPEIPKTFVVSSGAWSHDGKSVIVTGHPIVQSVEWTTKPITDP